MLLFSERGYFVKFNFTSGCRSESRSHLFIELISYDCTIFEHTKKTSLDSPYDFRIDFVSYFSFSNLAVFNNSTDYYTDKFSNAGKYSIDESNFHENEDYVENEHISHRYNGI